MSTQPNTVTDALEMALQYHSAGRLEAAQLIYQTILADQPDHPDALHLSGIVAQQHGNLATAAALVGKAIAVCPSVAMYHCTLAKILRDGSTQGAAIESFQRAIDLDHAMVEAYFGLSGSLRAVGRDSAAVEALRHVTTLRPADPEGHAYLAAALKGAGDLEGAIAAYRVAVSLQPLYSVANNNLGNLLRDLGRVEEAEAAYGAALAAAPDYAEAHSNLGNLLFHRGDYLAAEEHCQSAVDAKPDFAEAHNNLGNALRAQNRLDEAVMCYRVAVSLRPQFADAHNNLGLALHELETYDEAAQSLETALTLRTPFPEAMSNLASVKCSQGKYEEAETLYHKALALCPEDTKIIGGLAVAVQEQGRIAEAMGYYDQAIAIDPALADAYTNNIGAAHQSNGDLKEAIACMRRAVELTNGDAQARGNLGIALLMDGQYEEGWREYEWRWQYKLNWKRHVFDQPRWDGSPLAGRKILLFAEQGFGDALQFVRYVPLVAAMGGTVYVECHPQLKTLLSSVAGAAGVFAKGEELPAFDCVAPLMSLPMILGTTLETVPATVPYLKPDTALIDDYAARTPSPEGKRRVGLCWQGDPKHKNDRNRSIPLNCLEPLLNRTDIACFSLQKLYGSEQIAAAGLEAKIADYTEVMRLDDFADAAAMIMTLDLVITVDSAIAHLAGALGKPTWLLLPYASEWRWLRNRVDSPWYPQAKLFRQEQRGQWDNVLAKITAALDQDTAS